MLRRESAPATQPRRGFLADGNGAGLHAREDAERPAFNAEGLHRAIVTDHVSALAADVKQQMV